MSYIFGKCARFGQCLRKRGRNGRFLCNHEDLWRCPSDGYDAISCNANIMHISLVIHILYNVCLRIYIYITVYNIIHCKSKCSKLLLQPGVPRTWDEKECMPNWMILQERRINLLQFNACKVTCAQVLQKSFWVSNRQLSHCTGECSLAKWSTHTVEEIITKIVISSNLMIWCFKDCRFPAYDE